MQEKEQVERLVGQINGRFSEAGWVPIRYLYRSYAQSELAGFYHDADVCLVTPLRDGMNLVAKEFVAAQGEDSPGVLVLSRFAGAASTMRDAVIVNPYDIEGTAEATYQALRMPLEERRQPQPQAPVRSRNALIPKLEPNFHRRTVGRLTWKRRRPDNRCGHRNSRQKGRALSSLENAPCASLAQLVNYTTPLRKAILTAMA